MILLGRLLTYIVPFIFFVIALLWLISVSYIYYSIIFLFFALLLLVYLNTKAKFSFKSFLIEMANPLLLMLIGGSSLVFLPKNIIYVVLAGFFAITLFFLVNDIFARYHPALSKGEKFNFEAKIVYYIVMVFFSVAVAYNFILYLAWSLYVVWLVLLLVIMLLSILIANFDISKQFFKSYGISWLLTTEFFLILYYLPIDIYIKSFVIALNLFVLIHIINKINYYKIQ